MIYIEVTGVVFFYMYKYIIMSILSLFSVPRLYEVARAQSGPGAEEEKQEGGRNRNLDLLLLLLLFLGGRYRWPGGSVRSVGR